MTFRTCAVADIDGNLYQTVVIGDLEWFAENLKVTKYNDGTPIQNLTEDEEWFSSELPSYCWYDNDEEAYKDKYGALYNYETVYVIMSSNKKLCPDGWHVPVELDWGELREYLRNNGYGFDGSGDDIAKSLASKTDWDSDIIEGNVGNSPETNNSSGFTAFPAGTRKDGENSFNYMGQQTRWWFLPDTYELDYPYFRSYNLFYSTSTFEGNNSRSSGLSIRCIKDW